MTEFSRSIFCAWFIRWSSGSISTSVDGVVSRNECFGFVAVEGNGCCAENCVAVLHALRNLALLSLGVSCGYDMGTLGDVISTFFDGFGLMFFSIDTAEG